MDAIKLRFLEIPSIKFAHFVVCYKKHVLLTFCIGFRSFGSYKIFFSPFFWLIWRFFGDFDALKWGFLEIPSTKFTHFVLCYKRNLVLSFCIGFRHLGSYKIFFFAIFWLLCPFWRTKIEISRNRFDQIRSFCIMLYKTLSINFLHWF